MRARAFELCRAGNLKELQPLVDGQEDLGPGLALKLSCRQGEKGKTGATLLHMYDCRFLFWGLGGAGGGLYKA